MDMFQFVSISSFLYIQYWFGLMSICSTNFFLALITFFLIFIFGLGWVSVRFFNPNLVSRDVVDEGRSLWR